MTNKPKTKEDASFLLAEAYMLLLLSLYRCTLPIVSFILLLPYSIVKVENYVELGGEFDDLIPPYHFRYVKD